MRLALNQNIKIISRIRSTAVEHALENLKRDIRNACRPTADPGIQLVLEQEALDNECFLLIVTKEKNQLKLSSGSDLGFVYGIYEISRSILGIPAFWFWNDYKPEKKESYPIPDDYRVESSPFRVGLRGWFVNDEVLLKAWEVDYSEEKPWEMVFEALLRCGGNMVIPGTDKNSRKYRKLASDMGLYITHHHAEPLGAEMFARAYPELEASYDVHGDKFRMLWEEGIEQQKDLNVVWNLGFRGQGDRPFWDDDPVYDTPEARGELMGSLIQVQYDMVKDRLPDAKCCTNLYGETMELYQQGFLKLPDDVIKIWADNGFGKMVTRRQWNHNPRIPALPEKSDPGKNGIYYHVSFYDLQAANHITMLQNPPEFVERELTNAMERGCSDYWIINSSNVKPHTYYLDFIARMWREGRTDIAEHRREYGRTYYGGENADLIADCLEAYHKAAVLYGPNEDDHAGDQFSTHVGRMLVSRYMKGTRGASEDLLWLTDVKTLEEQIRVYEKICREGSTNYRKYLDICEAADARIKGRDARRLFRDSLILHGEIHYHCFTGAYLICQSLLAAMEEDYRRAFFFGGMAREEYLTADNAMRSREHGKWNGFYANDCLTDVKQSAWVLEGYMSYVRNLGDGPDFHDWQRELTYSDEDRRIMLILMTEKHLPDAEIYELMKKREWFGTDLPAK